MSRRYTCAFRPTTAGSTTLPMAALCSVANRSGYLREVGIFNTTATAWAARLARLTTAGTPGTGQTVDKYNPNDDTNDLLVKDVYTSTGPTIPAGNIRQASIGAAIGAGVIWTFAEPGVFIPAGTANGIAVVALVGSPQISDVYFEWEE